jgi:hypothetical protein
VRGDKHENAYKSTVLYLTTLRESQLVSAPPSMLFKTIIFHLFVGNTHGYKTPITANYKLQTLIEGQA